MEGEEGPEPLLPRFGVSFRASLADSAQGERTSAFVNRPVLSGGVGHSDGFQAEGQTTCYSLCLTGTDHVKLEYFCPKRVTMGSVLSCPVPTRALRRPRIYAQL